MSRKDDPNDFETYAYEYKTQTYMRSPRESGDGRKRDYKEAVKHSASAAKRSVDNPRKSIYQNVYRDDRHEYRVPKTDYREKEHHSNRAELNHAATKIQAAFRGYQTRKDFWKKRERYRRESSLNTRQYREDEYTIASATSIVDDDMIPSLSTNADPNLGLTPRLPFIDSAERLNIIRTLKGQLTFSDDIRTVHQLQSEESPNIIVLGGINPPLAKDYLLGASMFMYCVQKNKWFFSGTMPEPRNYHTATYLNGKIYIVGGYSPLQIAHNQMMATQSTFQLSVRSKRWRKRADMHHARACHAACIVNDNIIVFGGRDATGKLLSSVELYYPKKDQWVLLKSMPEAVMGMSGAVLDGCVFAVGGIVNEGHPSRFSVSDRTYAFDFEKQMWYKAPQLPEPRAFACAATLKREIWLWCGVKDALSEDGYLVSTNTVLVYNPDVSKWESQTTVGTLKHAVAVAKVGRRVYILGGMSNAPGSKEVLDENDYYNRETDKYMEGASLPRAIAGLAAVALPKDYVPTSDWKWNSEDITDDVKNEAATKIQSAYRGFRTRSIISDDRFPIGSSSRDARGKSIQNDIYAMHSSVTKPWNDSEKWNAFQRVQIEDWPPIPDMQASNSEVNMRFGTLPRGYTVTTTNSRDKVRRYVLLPPHADPNLSMIGHLCNVYKRAKKILGLRKVERLPSFAINLVTAPTLQDDCIPVILLMGGLQPKDPVNLSCGKLILRYHTLKNRFEYFGALPEPRNYHAAVYYKENVYVSGGCDPDKRNSGEMVATNTMYCLNIHTSEWVEKAEMNCSRAYHNLVVALGKIFAIGGRDNNGRLVASIEAYDIERDSWTTLRAMTEPRMGMACTVIDDHIWCMGGIGISNSSESYPVVSSVVSYDIGKDLWMSRPPLRCPRAFGTCVLVNDSMWIVGGASKDRDHEVLVSMASVDKYYSTNAQWGRKTLISNPRHCAAIVAIDTCIYIFGGVSSQEWSPLSRNEMLVVDDTSLHTCEPLPIPLTGVAAVSIPPVVPSLRSESFAQLLHTKLTFH